jgi:hypothetical protein
LCEHKLARAYSTAVGTAIYGGWTSRLDHKDTNGSADQEIAGYVAIGCGVAALGIGLLLLYRYRRLQVQATVTGTGRASDEATSASGAGRQRRRSMLVPGH